MADEAPSHPAGMIPVNLPGQASRKNREPNMADQVMAMQRRNLAAAANASSSRSRQPREPKSRSGKQDDFSRTLPGQPVQPHQKLYNPTHPHAEPRPKVFEPTHEPGPSRPRPREERERPTGRLYEIQPGPSRREGSEGDGQPPRHRERSKSRMPPPGSTQPQRKLFDPRVHDPVRFSTNSSIPPPPAPRSKLPRTAEEEADRERERRKRREGSERGVGSVASGVSKKEKKERDADGRSKGSRSSEGSESFKDRERGRGKGDTGIMTVLRESYKHINSLEQQLVEIHRKMASDPALGILVYLANRDGATADARSLPALTPLEEGNAWVDLIVRHKRLADAHHDFLVLSLDPQLPSSLHGLPIRYNIPARLWQTGYHLILERLRHSWASAATTTVTIDRNGRSTAPHDPNAAQRMLDILTDFIYDAYTFYTSLLEEQALGGFRTAWIEALGDLARYRMAIASHLDAAETAAPAKAASAARIDDDEDQGPQPAKASIGADVADSWDVEDRETWRTTARDWYAMGITEKPGEGRLHHHLALLCRDVPGEEAKALYHFSKSLTTSHPFRTSRESILPLFDGALQSQRSMPDADAMDLFVRLHGMLFTRIQLDDFDAVFARFMERLEEDVQLEGERPSVSQVDWLMMATTNLAAVLQYGSDEGRVKTAMAEVARKGKQSAPQALMLHADMVNEDSGPGTDPADDGEDDGEEDMPFEEDLPVLKSLSITEDEAFPLALTNALQLAFVTLEFVLGHPTRLQGYQNVVNPYIPILFTFLATILRQPAAIDLLEAHIPWQGLVNTFNSVPNDIEFRPELVQKLVLGPPIPEDWCMRGMEWVGRRVYERGFWKGKQASTGARNSGSSGPPQPRVGGERFQSELDVLHADFDAPSDSSDGIVEEVEGSDQTDSPGAVSIRRWRRVAWAAGVIAKNVDGLEISFPDAYHAGVVRIERGGALDRKMKTWAENKNREEEEARAKRPVTVHSTEDDAEVYVDEESDEEDPELMELRERRKHLQSLLGVKPGLSKKERHHRSLNVIPGFTSLVFDTNVLLSALKLFSRVVASGKWTVIVPLPVITELDGLAKSPPPLGPAAASAIAYLETHIRTYNRSLKVQTSRGNYLSNLAIRTESIPQNSSASQDEMLRSMDDHILNVAVFQQAHHHAATTQPGGTKVLLLTFDRNLRVRARARGVEAADEQEMARVLGAG